MCCVSYNQARLAVEAYLQQVLRFGFFHADPHPGRGLHSLTLELNLSDSRTHS
jgi:hypothetical protein